MAGLLASVRSAAEARIALDGGADIIDCKEPRDGALGALGELQIRRVVAEVDGTRPVSATVGDLHDPAELVGAIRVTRDTGVDLVKFGLFDAAHARACLAAVAPLARHQPLIAVCFADRFDPLPLLPGMAGLGLRGVMIDTADKHAGRLTELWDAARRQTFVERARALGLLCGLAGRLRSADIPALLPHGADYLGFRSALCGGERNAGLQSDALRAVRELLPRQPLGLAGHG